MRLKNPQLMAFAKNWACALMLPFPGATWIRFPRYFAEWRTYARATKENVRWIDTYPCLNDRRSDTPFDPHYFYQAAWLARRLAIARPERHVDIGSDIRAIAVLSAFVEVDFIDYRPLNVSISGLSCRKGDILNLGYRKDVIQSLSCLHVVEHIGLGRYGDPLDPKGTQKALGELERVVAPGGYLYLSAPVGRERVCFNAHRVLSAQRVVEVLRGMELEEFSLVTDGGEMVECCNIADASNQEYGCGLFVFRKVE